MVLVSSFTGNARVGDGFPLVPIVISLLYNQGNTTMLYIFLWYSYVARYWNISPGEWPCTLHGVKCRVMAVCKMATIKGRK